MKQLVIFGAALAAALFGAGHSFAADYTPRGTTVITYRHDPAFERGYTALLPACDDPSVLSSVTSAFSHREKAFWGSGLELVEFHRPREVGYRSWGASFIPRRFCVAHSRTNDGRKRVVSYNIAEQQGFAGYGWGVEWCVSGLDRSLAYAPGCKMARP